MSELPLCSKSCMRCDFTDLLLSRELSVPTSSLANINATFSERSDICNLGQSFMCRQLQQGFWRAHLPICMASMENFSMSDWTTVRLMLMTSSLSATKLMALCMLEKTPSDSWLVRLMPNISCKRKTWWGNKKGQLSSPVPAPLCTSPQTHHQMPPILPDPPVGRTVFDCAGIIFNRSCSKAIVEELAIC